MGLDGDTDSHPLSFFPSLARISARLVYQPHQSSIIISGIEVSSKYTFLRRSTIINSLAYPSLGPPRRPFHLVSNHNSGTNVYRSLADQWRSSIDTQIHIKLVPEKCCRAQRRRPLRSHTDPVLGVHPTSPVLLGRRPLIRVIHKLLALVRVFSISVPLKHPRLFILQHFESPCLRVAANG